MSINPCTAIVSSETRQSDRMRLVACWPCRRSVTVTLRLPLAQPPGDLGHSIRISVTVGGTISAAPQNKGVQMGRVTTDDVLRAELHWVSRWGIARPGVHHPASLDYQKLTGARRIGLLRIA